MQIRPQEPFPIVYLITDPLDTNTYYVQSKIRDTGLGTVLQTVNLTDNGSRRFSKTVQAPNDPSGLGLFIDVTTTVYTDSGYTTKSDKYLEKIETFLVAERWSHGAGGVGGAMVEKTVKGDNFDYEKLIKLLVAALLPFVEKEKEETDLTPITREINLLRESIEDLAAKPGEKTDLMPVLQSIDRVFARIEQITIPEAVDLFPVLEGIQNLANASGEQKADLVAALTSGLADTKKHVGDLFDKSSRYDKDKKKLYAVLKELVLGEEESEKEIPLENLSKLLKRK